MPRIKRDPELTAMIRSTQVIAERLSIYPKIRVVAILMKTNVRNILTEALTLWWEQKGKAVFRSKGGRG